MIKEEWLKKQGFSFEGIAYSVVGNSYAIKDILKAAGFKYSPQLKWHAPNNDFVLPPDCKYVQLSFDNLFIWDEKTSSTLMKDGARDFLKTLFEVKKPQSISTFVGEIGERLRKIECKILKQAGRPTAYGYYYSYLFADNNGNLYSWNTKSPSIPSTSKKGLLSGTVIKHITYKDKKITQLNRCKMEFENE